MTLRRFALFILIGSFPGSNAALAAGDVEGADVSERKTVADVSVEVADLNRLVEVRGEQWRIRRSKNPTGSMMLLRNETGVPLIASFTGEDGQDAAGDRVPAGGTVERRCEAGAASYPVAVASERGEGVLNAQLRCGDSIVVQSPDRLVAPLEALNEASAAPPGESVAEPFDMAGEH